MQTNQPGTNAAMALLAVLVGEWTQQVDMTGVPAGRTVFEWALGGAPLEFAQRFTGIFEDESTINGAWEHSQGRRHMAAQLRRLIQEDRIDAPWPSQRHSSGRRPAF